MNYTPGQIERAKKNYNAMLQILLLHRQAVAKLAANKEASASVLEPIRAIKKITAFGEWLNTKGNPFRGQFFSKKYTQESVAAYLQTL